MASRSEILNILETRYDHYSAKTIFSDVLEAAKLESKSKYEPAEVTKIANTLIRVGIRVERAVDRIRALGSGKPPKAAPAAKAEPAPAEPAPAEPEATNKTAAPKAAPAKKTKKAAKKKG